VVNYDAEEENLSVLFAGLPFLLLTMDRSEYDQETRILKLAKIRTANNGEFAIQQQIEGFGQVWYI
jgi:hypothetical protein